MINKYIKKKRRDYLKFIFNNFIRINENCL